jgi:hypothetical protein
MNDLIEPIGKIRSYHRRRRFAMKIQQKLDRALESFIRINMTAWHPDLPEAERKKINAQVVAMINKVRNGDESEALAGLVPFVMTSDRARAPADEMRAEAEAAMEQVASELPVYPWVKSIRGAGALGLATIIAEAGHLSGYANVAKLWKRLGYAPYDGFAGSTWKRETWRPRALTKDEWIANPFKGERYALTAQIATWLVNAQTKSKTKTESGETEAAGPYGAIYVKRRAACVLSHPDWTDGHRRSDALRIAMKEFLKHLFLEWHRLNPYEEKFDATQETKTVATLGVKPSETLRPSSPATATMKSTTAVPGSPFPLKTVAIDAMKPRESLRPSSPASNSVKPKPPLPGSSIPPSA